MNAPRIIPPAVLELQVKASNPAGSVFVAANAGAGKTHVLAQRVIRLLLQGVPPSRILCITFTKAAAANMANRVFDTLRRWTSLDDAALDKAMQDVGVKRPGAIQRAQARRLFALALETPGGLKVQTIHAFCAHLLYLFPFEANVAARFSVLEEAAERQMLDQLTMGVLLEAAATPDGPLGRALQTAIAAAADQTFRDVVNEAIRERDRVTAWIASSGGVAAAISELSRTLGIDPNDTRENVEADVFAASLIAPTEWPAVAAALNEGSKSDQDQSARFAALATLTGDARLDNYLSVFCTAELEPRKNLVTRSMQTRHPALFQRLVDEQRRICALIACRRAVAARDRTAALITVADAVLTRFRTEKDRRGLLDYNDLIDRTLVLLAEERAAWVHYKLDRGIDHVLIDEAQDTSPKQWQIILRLVSEFFAGEGASSAHRTIFAVGDEKQSIFSFQGAVPSEFAEMRKYFKTAHDNAGLKFEPIEFKHSFRSGANVLGAVDTVFARQEAFRGLTADPVAPVHESLPGAAPGLVELWETEKPPEQRTVEGWDAPLDTLTESSAVVRLAQKIAGFVARRHRAHPGEVLILVRRRGALFEAVIRALKNAGIAVAGADRLVLTEHIAVMDLIVLADALLLPEDDLALATVLKSPLFGLDDDDLFALAWNRGERSLRAALDANTDSKFAQAAKRLDRLAKAAREQTPFAFYAHLLGAEGGRRRFLARLGHEAADALDEFLNLALDYERAETPSLQGFLAWLRAAKAEVKRDMEIARDEVRVMTVHGAKGLEARVVILADTTTPPHGFHPPRLLKLPRQNAAPGTPDHIVWAGPKANDVGPMAAAREAENLAAADEYRRLLYVAMTRAIEHIVICGIDGERKRPEGCWYDLARDALEPISARERTDDGEGQVLRYRQMFELVAIERPSAEGEPPSIALPDWLMRNAPAEPSAQPLAPSRALEDAPSARAVGAVERRQAMRRGSVTHRLMQSLPDIPPEQRLEAARRYLARQKEFDDAERDSIAQGVLGILAAPRFAALFAPGSRAEVPIAGRVNGRPVPGVVDRLAVTADAVMIADYKTNRPAPQTLDELRARYPDYIAQLALYRKVLMRLYPDRTIRAALVWTETPELMEVPAADLGHALENLTSP